MRLSGSAYQPALQSNACTLQLLKSLMSPETASGTEFSHSRHEKDSALERTRDDV